MVLNLRSERALFFLILRALNVDFDTKTMIISDSRNRLPTAALREIKSSPDPQDLHNQHYRCQNVCW
jgi:hypothetical protein